MAGMKAYPSFNAFLADQPRANQAVIRELRTFVKRIAPALDEAVKWGNGCWVKGTKPVAFAYSAVDHVQFGFFAGSKLRDPRRLLKGSGAYVRHIKIASPADLDAKAVAPLLRQAVKTAYAHYD